jgi:hypothetical protein
MKEKSTCASAQSSLHAVARIFILSAIGRDQYIRDEYIAGSKIAIS